MIHHISIGVVNYNDSVKFYLETLRKIYTSDIKPIEGTYPPVIENNKILFQGVRFNNIINVNNGTCLSIMDQEYGIRGSITPRDYGSVKGFHVCFAAKTEEQVNQWYNKALELGATDNGAPGIRPHYGKYYYGAFVIDPNGYRLEACIKDYVKDNNLEN